MQHDENANILLQVKIRVGLLTFLIVTGLTLPFTSAQASSEIIKSVETAPGVSIDTTLYVPKKLPAPAVMIAHGFGGSKGSVSAQAQKFRDAGYVVLTWSARGFGKSTGQIAMNAPEAEVADSMALITYLAKTDKVIMQKPGDPLVAIMGSSYGGANALITASLDKRIDTVIADITWSNLQDDLFPQSTEGIKNSGVFKKVWTGTFFTAGALQNAYLGECGSFSDAWCSAYRSAALTGVPTKAQAALMADVSPLNYVSKITVPTLLTQGQADSLFPLSESAANAKKILSAHPRTSLSMIWHAGGHDGGLNESAYLDIQTLKWLSKYLNKKNINFPKFQFTNTNGSISLQDSTVIPKVYESAQLPIDGRRAQLAVVSPLTALSYPIGGIPTAISALPGIGSAGALAGRVLSNIAGFSPAFLPGQSGFLDSAPLQKPLTIIGPSRIKVRVTSTTGDATLFFSLVVKSPNGSITQPNGIVAPVKLENIPKSGVDILVQLPNSILSAAVGDEIAVGVSSTDQGYELPKPSRFYSIAALSAIEYQSVDAKPAAHAGGLVLWPVAALIMLLLSFIYVRMRKPKVVSDVLDSDYLIEVANLGKVYKDGYRAVKDLSFTVERGQVVGLLGPNGAGKTTALRMMMGLIFPTEGAIYLDGKPIYPGSATLSNLGSFVEGPGFLPHLTGRENLDLYWRAIGRTSDRFLDEVVAITKLGTALDKKVRSYSQGMRQRLAIAQAMLGMPDLLVLDEPTNGLDPQQIAEMRQVLKDYAKSGRTVIISSHLLAEVEQTCSHVVLMHRGELISFGPMKKILTRNRRSRSLEEIFLELIGDDLMIGKEES